MAEPRFRLRRTLYALRRPLWSLYWITSGFRLWREERFSRWRALERGVRISLTCATWHACGCNFRRAS